MGRNGLKRERTLRLPSMTPGSRFDEAHLLADDRGRERFPLSGLLAALGSLQPQQPRVRIVLCGLPTLSLNLRRARTYAERMFRHAVVGNLELDAG